MRLFALSVIFPAGGRFFGRSFWLILPLLLLLLAAGFALLEPAGAAANGRATRIASQEQGPYRVEVSILPARAVVNNTHLSVQVLDLGSGAVLTDVVARVSGVGPAAAGGRPAAFGPIAAVNDVSPQFFEAILPFAVPGEWELSISINSDLGQETIQVDLPVRAGESINLIWVAAVAVAVLALGIWTYDRVRGRRRPARSAG